MLTVITPGDYENLRADYQRSTFYISPLKPKTLWTAQVTTAAARGIVAIGFDNGSGLDFSAIEAEQVVWVGSGVGKKDYAVLRIRSISSGDSGVTGTVNVAWHGYAFGPNAYLSFIHDYPIAAKFPWLGQAGIMGSNEVFYKDIFDTYSNQTQSTKIKPIADVRISPRAGFVRDGELTFWVDASNSYPMAPGATISSYALSVYPTTGVTTTFSTSTGLGRVVVTSLTLEYYWLKFTITDSNATSRTFYQVVHAHDPDRSAGNYPLVNFQVGQYADDWESGGVSARIVMNRQLTDIFIGDRQAVDMIDVASTVFWCENVMGNKFKGARHVPTKRSSDHLFVDPDISVSVSSPGSTCDIDTTFHAGIMIDGAVPANSVTVGLHVQVNAETPIAVTSNIANGILTATPPTINALAGACSGGTLKWLYSSVEIASTEIWSGKIEVGSTIYPSWFLAFPFTLLNGYLRESDIDTDTKLNTGTHEYELSTPESILKNSYMFSIPIDAKQSPTKWHHFHSSMTTAAAAMFVLEFHSNYLNVVNVPGLNVDGVKRPYGEFQGANLYQMVDGIIRNEGIRAHFKCDREGRMGMIYDVQLMTNRGAVPVVSEVFKSDRSGELSIKENPEPRVSLVYGSGLYWGGGFDGDGKVGDDEVDAYCSLAPWYIPNWNDGASTTNFERQTVLSQLHMNQLTGRKYAQLNNPFPRFSFGWRGNFLPVLNIAWEEYWMIDVQTTDNPKSLVFPNQNLLLKNVECTFDVSKGMMKINSTWEPEADSLDGVTAICPELNLDIDGIPPIDWVEFPPFYSGTIVTSS